MALSRDSRELQPLELPVCEQAVAPNGLPSSAYCVALFEHDSQRHTHRYSRTPNESKRRETNLLFLRDRTASRSAVAGLVRQRGTYYCSIAVAWEYFGLRG